MKFTWTSKLSHLQSGAVVGSRHLHCSFRSSQGLWKVLISLADQGEKRQKQLWTQYLWGSREEAVRQSSLDSPAAFKDADANSVELEWA